jgi:outer membrane biosynthesis protein TonB
MKQLEWVVEREDDSPIFRASRMPWHHGGEDDVRFRKSLLVSLLISIVFAILFPIIPLPEPDPFEVIEVPERLTRLIKEEPPPPPVVQERLEPQKTQAETPDEPEKLAQDTKPKSAPSKEVSEVVASAGILALRDQFAGLAESDPASRLGSRARINRAGESAAGQGGRSLVTTQSPGSSGGIDIAAIGREAVGGGGQALEGVQVARATSSIGTGGGNDRPLSDGPGLSRTDEEIQIVFDRHKSALYRLYNRELRRNPTLQGQIVLKIVIEPDGSVSLCEVSSSDMDAPGLAAKVVERVKLFDFGAKDGIPPVSILYPIDFLPAA